MIQPRTPYRHHKPRRLHAGHLRRMRGYVEGGIGVVEAAGLCGVHHSAVRYMMLRHGWRRPDFSRREAA